jgi:hypothetical protein
MDEESLKNVVGIIYGNEPPAISGRMWDYVIEIRL